MQAVLSARTPHLHCHVVRLAPRRQLISYDHNRKTSHSHDFKLAPKAYTGEYESDDDDDWYSTSDDETDDDYYETVSEIETADDDYETESDNEIDSDCYDTDTDEERSDMLQRIRTLSSDSAQSGLTGRDWLVYLDIALARWHEEEGVSITAFRKAVKEYAICLADFQQYDSIQHLKRVSRQSPDKRVPLQQARGLKYVRFCLTKL